MVEKRTQDVRRLKDHVKHRDNKIEKLKEAHRKEVQELVQRIELLTKSNHCWQKQEKTRVCRHEELEQEVEQLRAENERMKTEMKEVER